MTAPRPLSHGQKTSSGTAMIYQRCVSCGCLENIFDNIPSSIQFESLFIVNWIIFSLRGRSIPRSGQAPLSDLLIRKRGADLLCISWFELIFQDVGKLKGKPCHIRSLLSIDREKWKMSGQLSKLLYQVFCA